MNLEPRKIPKEDQLILMIETSQRQGSIALGSIGGDFIAQVPFSPGLVHSKELMPRIDTLIEEHASRSDLGVIAVSRGPGSFTGIRIGVAAAKALSWGLNIPALGLSSLECMVHGLGKDGRWAAILDASGGDRDMGIFEASSGNITPASEEMAVQVEELPALIAEGTGVVGSGCRNLEWSEGIPVSEIEYDQPPARSGWELSVQAIRTFREDFEPPTGWQNPHQLQPRYLRVSRAEEVRRKKLAEQERS
ncbi:MAG: tRNA (adenosine(37)-N6)-threonylcarbamoyltransferase complex dimerization subunit type 1 TsaB [Planctomycetia bacterium]|nr:tRNA (adenosine(37)-N6)-threonylcarbamoyltransferase complex dimerization subunit type 1 TsaB [Planctomycetia bacterium]